MKNERNEEYAFAASGISGGMSLRDYFAAAALNGFLSSPSKLSLNGTQHEFTKEDIARGAYNMADAMIEARAK